MNLLQASATWRKHSQPFLDPENLIMVGQVIGDRYRVIEILGSGNIANTYLTEDLQLEDRQRCVVKRLIAKHPDPKLVEAKKHLFAKEATTLQALGSHDQIPQLLGYLEDSEECYLVQEFVDGYPLTGEITSGIRWSALHVIQFLEEMLGLLMFVHDRGVIHQDIKPSNIMRRQVDHRLVLIDFGAAMPIPANRSPFLPRTRTNFVVGTPGYMPVEQANGRSQPSSDLYSLGMIAIQVLTGLAPRQLQEDNQGEWIWRLQANDVSDEFAAVLSRMVRYHYRQRFQSAAEALEAIRSLKRSTTMGDRSSSNPTAPPDRASISDNANQNDLDTDLTEVFFPPRHLQAFDSQTARTADCQDVGANGLARFTWPHLPWLHRPIPLLMGATGMVLVTLLFGFADLIQAQPLIAQEQQPFNPQNLQRVGRYDEAL